MCLKLAKEYTFYRNIHNLVLQLYTKVHFSLLQFSLFSWIQLFLNIHNSRACIFILQWNLLFSCFAYVMEFPFFFFFFCFLRGIIEWNNTSSTNWKRGVEKHNMYVSFSCRALAKVLALQHYYHSIN
jgi:hypothetical protein